MGGTSIPKSNHQKSTCVVIIILSIDANLKETILQDLDEYNSF